MSKKINKKKVFSSCIIFKIIGHLQPKEMVEQTTLLQENYEWISTIRSVYMNPCYFTNLFIALRYCQVKNKQSLEKFFVFHKANNN